MIIELRDIINSKEVVAHSQPLPPGTTLGYIFDQHPKLRAISPYIVQVKINGSLVNPWQNSVPTADDKISICIAPQEFFSVSAVLDIISTVVSVIQFVVSLFMRPKPIKSEVQKESPTYSFEGIKTSFSPGGPVPVLYGEHMNGGQLLSMAIDVSTTGREQNLSMLIGLGHGIITDVSCVKVNNIPIENFSNTTSWEWRAGYSSQAVIRGFERVRNTFADGREIASGSSLIYVTVSNEIEEVQLQVAALEGLGFFAGGSHPRLITQSVLYSIEYRQTGTNTWTVVQSPRQFSGQNRAAVWDAPIIDFGSRAAWDVRVKFIDHVLKERGSTDTSLHRIWLRNVTEVIDRTEVYSGIALLAVRAVATAQLQGGAPNITAMERGKSVRAYSDETTFVTTWTRNPAWPILDYMTNSLYGMGAYIPTSRVHMQSFIDFAALCDSLVPDGSGGLEAQHMLDINMDKKKPHWTWISDMQRLYRSSMIYSQGRHKVISDRRDLPVRQVFHSGNIVPGTFQLTIGTEDPIKPNQATVSYPNRDQDYNIDILYVQNSASVFGAGDPIKEFDLSLIGVTRQSEALREADWQLSRRRRTVREAQFTTGLEALAVEPGDICRVGIVTTDFEFGYGGRVLDGNINHLVLDREIQINSGYTYDMLLWHTGADSIEERTLATTPGPGNATITTAVVSPTAAFNIIPEKNARWAIGITSEDLTLSWVKKVKRNEAGLHELVTEQFVPLDPTTPSLVSTGRTFNFNLPPPQPISAVGTVAANILPDGTVGALTMIDVVPAPLEEGGKTTYPGCTSSVRIVGSHAPVNDALHNDQIHVISGPASGAIGVITAYRIIGPYGAGLYGAGPYGGAAYKEVEFKGRRLHTATNSGDNYMILHRMGDFAGFDVLSRTDPTAGFAYTATVLGTHYEQTSDTRSVSTTYKLIPFSSRGVRNTVGNWVIPTSPPVITAPATPSGLTVNVAIANVVGLDWNDNTEADLAYYTLYRGTSPLFGSASAIANVAVSRFTDVISIDPNVGQNYNYWIRAVNTSSMMSPVHPDSSNGVSTLPRAVLTTEITSSAVTAFATFTNDNSFSLNTVNASTIGFVQLNAIGGEVLLQGKCVHTAVQDPAGGETRVVLVVDSLGGTLLDTITIRNTPITPVNLLVLHSPGSRSVNYYLSATEITGSVSVNFRKMTAVELKR